MRCQKASGVQMAVEDSRGIGLFDPCAAVSGILTFPKLPRGRGREEGRKRPGELAVDGGERILKAKQAVC